MYIGQPIDPTGRSPDLGWLGNLSATADEAEARRLKEEIMKLWRRNEWQGVERNYQAWFKLRPGDDWEVYSAAAQAAMQLGFGTARYLRLLRALGANPPPEQASNLAADKQSLELGWANVDIRLRRNAKEDLQREGGLPFGGPELPAIQRAQKELRGTGKFIDLLPANVYSLNGREIRLTNAHGISRVALVQIREKGDGTFELRTRPGPWEPRLSDRYP